MTQNDTTPSAKDRVLAWVREKNPQRIEVHLRHCNYGDNHGVCKYGEWDCPALHDTMGLQELAIAIGTLDAHYMIDIDSNGEAEIVRMQWEGRMAEKIWIVRYDLTKNLHSQSPEFYEALLPLLP